MSAPGHRGALLRPVGLPAAATHNGCSDRTRPSPGPEGNSMTPARRRFLILAVVAAALPAAAQSAQAQAFPTRPLTVVVPFAAGGPTDTIARIMGERMRATLGQTVLIENVTGAAGSVGVRRVARATPDRHTISIGHRTTPVAHRP